MRSQIRPSIRKLVSVRPVGCGQWKAALYTRSAPWLLQPAAAQASLLALLLQLLDDDLELANHLPANHMRSLSWSLLVLAKVGRYGRQSSHAQRAQDSSGRSCMGDL